jgi:hypothetical protein
MKSEGKTDHEINRILTVRLREKKGEAS